jgi:hypothetical protein
LRDGFSNSILHVIYMLHQALLGTGDFILNVTLGGKASRLLRHGRRDELFQVSE